ncbi:prepilin-type N-terminal cleavage/methylation domain-containing protein [Pseudoalteromonas ruthenica]|uniref:prepilin-type N-terminal cleavage/methylation domain-containing protein n=1 Tax=Pseudoalteromonas ruthenica TaxID=151081 RepID=UPI000345F605|nr:prepilin-type N-terminal cleavage/methylation domain-containing protein [Pseudoalteromonas ruthenica]
MNTNHRGFTLIELLITISILSAVLLAGTFTYQTIAQRWQKEIGHFSASQYETKHLNILYDILAGLKPFVVLGENDSPGLLFVGSETRLLGVTKAGPFNTDYPEVFRLSVEETDLGKKRLLYQSVSTANTTIFRSDKEIIFTDEFILLDGLDDIRLNYFGWQSINQRSNGKEQGLLPTWGSTYSGTQTQLMPEKIAVLVKRGGKDLLFSVSLDTNSLRYVAPYLDRD